MHRPQTWWYVDLREGCCVLHGNCQAEYAIPPSDWQIIMSKVWASIIYCFLHFNCTIKNCRQNWSEPYLMHSMAYWLLPKGPFQQTGQCNWQQQNSVFACEYHVFHSHWSSLVLSKGAGLINLLHFTTCSYAFIAAILFGLMLTHCQGNSHLHWCNSATSIIHHSGCTLL